MRNTVKQTGQLQIVQQGNVDVLSKCTSPTPTSDLCNSAAVLKLAVVQRRSFPHVPTLTAILLHRTSSWTNLTASSGFETPVFAHGGESPKTWYGSHNLKRLSRLKREWDPEGLFSKTFCSFYRGQQCSQSSVSGNPHACPLNPTWQFSPVSNNIRYPRVPTQELLS